jgi:hypothetical protein
VTTFSIPFVPEVDGALLLFGAAWPVVTRCGRKKRSKAITKQTEVPVVFA